MTERGGAIIRCMILAPTPDATILNYLNDKEGGTIIFCRILAHPPPPRHNYNYLNDRERGAPLSFVGFWRPAMPPYPDATYLTILMTERGRHYLCRILAPPMPPSSKSTILSHLNDREKGHHNLL